MIGCRLSLLAVVAAELLGSTGALRLPVKHRARQGYVSVLGRRATFSPTVGNISIGDNLNGEYVSEITIGGLTTMVQLDTGSSDLNILAAVPSANDTTIPIGVKFAQGADNGVLSFADVQFAGYTVPKQIFNHGPGNTSSTSADRGLLGLGPTSGSVLSRIAQNNSISRAASDTLLDRIFQQNTSTPNYMTILLGRVDTVSFNVPNATVANGDLTIGELLPGMENITNMPELPVINASNSQNQHWTVLLDGATGSNGQPITFGPSIVPGTPSGKLVTIFDTGFTIPQVTQEIADGFYKNVPGASIQNVSGLGTIYTLPCSTALNASFTFQGQIYPIHPLDMSTFGYPSGVNCIGTFQPIQAFTTAAIGGDADMILGMGFLRNVYALMNFGDFVDEAGDATLPPFVQLLSTTNPAAATAEFMKARTSGASSISVGSGMWHVALGVTVSAAVYVLA